MAKLRKPKYIIVKKYGKFIHEIITPKESLPRTAKFRTIKVDSHRVTIAYWGRTISPGRHEFSAVHKILHPKKRKEPCKLKDRLRLLGIKELELGKEYKVVSKLPKLTGKRRAGKLVLAKNPKKRWYVGVGHDGRLKIFTYYKKPTRITHGHLYLFVYGPFKTEEEAKRMQSYYGRC